MLRLGSFVVFAVVLVSACGSPRQPSPPPAVATFENDFFSFEYPGYWHTLVPTSGDPAIVLLSSEPIAPTEPRVTGIAPDGVYIAWTEVAAAPLITPDPSFTSEVDVGGRPAVITQAIAETDCESLGGDELLTVTVDSPGSSPDVRMRACVRGPNIELTGATIAGMLASVEWRN
jgi:hypothetical protein